MKEIKSIDKKCPNCGATLLISKNGNLYCSKICWKSRESQIKNLIYEAQIESRHSGWGDR